MATLAMMDAPPHYRPAPWHPLRRKLAIATVLLPLAFMTVLAISVQYRCGGVTVPALMVFTIMCSPFLAIQAGVLATLAFFAGYPTGGDTNWGAYAAVWAAVCLGSGWFAGGIG